MAKTVEQCWNGRKWHGCLVVCVAISFILLVIGGWLTLLGLGEWYETLSFPPFQPPPWVFTPAWTIVLTLLALATWRVARQDGCQPGVALALGLYGSQCVLNAGWSLLFFTLQRPDVALWELLVLDLNLLLMILAYGRLSRVAGILLIPYLAWLLFATAINGWIVRHNPPFPRVVQMQSSSVQHSEHMQQFVNVAQ